MEEKRSSGGTKIKFVMMGISILTVIIFIGYLLMWLLMPTSLYGDKWSPNLRERVDSTYFGFQGATLLIYTFPILLIAVLACFYLHLATKNSQNFTETANERSLFVKWKSRPLIIKGLGIVSWTELILFIMFILLLVWHFLAYLHYFFGNISEFTALTGDRPWESKLEIMGFVLGVVGNVCLTFLFFPVSRCSSILQMAGLTSEASVRYHIWLGHIAMALFTGHGVSYVVYWAVTRRLARMLKWDDHSFISNVAGELSLLFGLVLWVATYPGIRKKMFELFFYTHYLYILFIVFFVFHIGISFSCIMLPGFFLFLIDRCLRFLQSRRSVRLVSARLLPCETVELNFSKSLGLNYTPTSIIFLNVPCISKLQWHPFTISSSSNLEPETLSIIIKNEGSWTKKLYKKLLSSPPSAHFSVAIEGPYGPPSTHFLRHDKLVMISGGSGISPFISIIKELIFAGTNLKCKTPKIQLISAFKKSLDLTMLDLLYPLWGISSGFSNLELDIEAYVTREPEEPPENMTKRIETIIFNPSESDVPIQPILGENNWLWMGAIISSSFIIFLLLIGILGRYYIYPIDHNTYMIYSISLRTALNMLVLCISILTSSVAVFLWNKKQTSTETKQIQDKAMPIKRIETADREMESLPRESIVKPSKLHYGYRPDLKKILSDCDESSIGVLVCGPKGMRHEVASICGSSAMTHKLHFEVISFTW